MINRRNFLRGLLAAGASFTVLPPAATYERIWRATRPEWIPNPDWVTAPLEMRGGVFLESDYVGKWTFVRGPSFLDDKWKDFFSGKLPPDVDAKIIRRYLIDGVTTGLQPNILTKRDAAAIVFKRSLTQRKEP
jgi:hypothetical protein